MIIKKYFNLENVASFKNKYKKCFLKKFEKKYNKFVILRQFFELRKFHLLKYKKLFKSRVLFIFLSPESYFVKFFIRKTRNFHFQKYKKNFFLKI